MNININRLTKIYNNKTVLSIPKLQIEKGALLGLIGPNGAGKSTLAKILGGLEEASSGNILYDEELISTSLLKKITVVAQKPYLLRGTVYYNIAYPLKIRKVEEAEIVIKVDEMLKEMELLEIKNQKAWTLSGGEVQKVALARALIFNPSLLILDEPTANIDPSTILVMEKMIKKINKDKGTTIIIVTHNLQQASRLCDKIAFIYRGEVIELSKREQLLKNPQNILTRDFIKGELLK
ncbi:ATP-binding cassette domain-containing protein [Alkaliphilus pronyensis]|uniref:ATP-binding cassette domain-containing protein n=1 Tax=Alkaliphilus pronyensis TaxID=1482732 RepID=A0A6I0F7U5_9FIRM|nr:ATP-binding cassette domain-containing protein [Alkaliphilus pronyensis]KAB3530313.1 ATP-binding cassette domain-containing protein [Alkaliphilus pronyensis]